MTDDAPTSNIPPGPTPPVTSGPPRSITPGTPPRLKRVSYTKLRRATALGAAPDLVGAATRASIREETRWRLALTAPFSSGAVWWADARRLPTGSPGGHTDDIVRFRIGPGGSGAFEGAGGEVNWTFCNAVGAPLDPTEIPLSLQAGEFAWREVTRRSREETNARILRTLTANAAGNEFVPLEADDIARFRANRSTI